jgi:cyanophycinase
MPSRIATLLLLLTPISAARAADAPFIDPAGLRGPLVVAGGRDHDEAIKAFVDLAGKEQARIVVIPTAIATAGDAETDTDVLKPFRELKPASIAILHTRDPKRANNAEFVKPLTEATGVWFANGHTDRLINAYRGTLFEREVTKLHERGGVVGGAGGGSSVMGGLVYAGGEKKPTTGFDLLHGFVIERKEMLEGAVKENAGFVGLRLPEGAAVVIQGRRARVIGTIGIEIAFPGSGNGQPVTEKYGAGSLLDIVQLRRAAANRASKDTFPPEKPPAPHVPKGTLVIVGGGGAAPEIWKRFIEASGGPEALIVVIPTAMEDPIPDAPPEEKILKKHGAKNVVTLHCRDPKLADDPRFSEVLTKAGGVWFGGGRQWRFVDAYAGTLTERRFHEVLARGGAIGGSSAGASIQSEYMPRGHPLGNTVMCAEGYEKGLCFLPGCAVDQHFFARKRTKDMTDLMRRYPQYLGIGIDEGTALVVTGCTAEVIGKSKVAFYDYSTKPEGEIDYVEVAAGEKYDLKSRKKVEK